MPESGFTLDHVINLHTNFHTLALIWGSSYTELPEWIAKEKTVNTCLKHYKLDPAYFYTASGLAWQALLKTVSEYCEHEVKRKECELSLDHFSLELLRDIDMMLLFKKSIPREITQAVKSYVKTNNKYMQEHCNHDETSIYLQYLNANNLNGWAMIQKLPIHGFAWGKVDYFTPEKKR